MDKRKFLKTAVAGSVLLGMSSAFAQSSPKNAPRKMSLSGHDEQDGKLIKLDSYAGKVGLVTFFTGGCNLCNHDLKLMREFYASNKSAGFFLLGVNMDAVKKDFDDYRRLVTLSVPKEQHFPMIWKSGADYVDNFGTVAKAPTHFVLDKSQNLVFKREGQFLPDDWDTIWSTLHPS